MYSHASSNFGRAVRCCSFPLSYMLLKTGGNGKLSGLLPQDPV